jgi:O-antigen/teichoic acid export membrane protein
VFARLSQYWRDVAWQASGNASAQLVGIVGIPVLSRLYTPAEFAMQSLFVQVVTYATALMTWRYEFFLQLPKNDEDAKSLNDLVLALGLINTILLTGLVWVFRIDLAAILGNSGLEVWIVIAPLTAFLVSLALCNQHRVQRARDFKTTGISQLVGQTSYVATAVTGALANLGATGLIVATAFSATGKIIWLKLRFRADADSRPKTQHPFRSALRLGKRYFKMANATVVSHLLSTTAVTIPLVGIGRLYGTYELGQYALVLATIYLPSGLLGAAIGQVYYQRAAQAWANSESLVPLWKKTVAKLLLIGVPAYMIISILSPIAYPFVFGGQWEQSGEFARYLSIAALCSFISSPLDRTRLIVGAWRYSLVWSTFRVVSASLVIWIGLQLSLPILSFIYLLTIQMCLVYMIDLLMGYWFCRGSAAVASR